MACCKEFKSHGFFVVLSPKVTQYSFDWFIRRDRFGYDKVSFETASSQHTSKLIQVDKATKYLKISNNYQDHPDQQAASFIIN